MKKQIAIIGVTGFGQHHLNQLLKLAAENLLEIACAVVINPESSAEQLEILAQHRTRIYSDSAEFFAREKGKIDLVCLPVGIGSHEALTREALSAGMNVLVEKPAAGSVEQVQNMITAEKASGRFVAVAFQHAYAPEIHFLKRLILSRRLGRILSSSVYACWPRNDAYYRRNSWAAKRIHNGVQVVDSPVNNACAHYLNLLLFLNGGCEESTALAVDAVGKVMRARPEIEMFDACNVNFTLDNGKNAHIMFAHCCKENINPQLKIICENGVIRWSGTFWSVTGNDGNVLASGNPVHPGEAMFRIVMNRLDDPEQRVYTLQNALSHTRCVEMIDRKLPIENITAVYENGIYCVPGLEAGFAAEYGE